MRSPATLSLYRSLLRQARAITRADLQLQLKQPLSSEWGSHGYSTHGLGYQANVLQELVPGLTTFPSADYLDGEGLRRVIRENFKCHKSAPPERQSELLDDAFRGLRAVLDQLYLEECSSSQTTRGVQVDITSKFNRTTTVASGRVAYIFTYRIRVINHGPNPIRILGRSWTIKNDVGETNLKIPLDSNAVVGQQPLLRSDDCWEYYSGTDVDTPSGMQHGELLIAVYERPGNLNDASLFTAQVGPVRLARPGVHSLKRLDSEARAPRTTGTP